MNQEQIFEWIREQKLQMEISEELGYELVFLLDLPKLLENYHQMRMKENTSGYIPNKFSQPNKIDYGNPPNHYTNIPFNKQ